MADEESTEQTVDSETTTFEDTTAPAQPEQDTQEIALSLWDQVFGFAEGLMRPWNAYQVLIAVAILLLSFGISRVLSPKLHDWMRTREGWPKWRYRYMLLLQRRMALIFFVVLVWIAVLIMREITWPSRSYLLGIFANLATAWLVIALITRLVHNSFLRGLLRYGAWIWVTLVLIGLNEEFRQLLDSAALNLGTLRLSVWTILQALVMLGATFAVARFVSGTTSARIRRNEDISPSMQVLVIKFLQVLLYGAAFFVGMRIVGVDLTGLAVLSGAIGVGLGFGLQKVVSNLVSGVIILLDKSIKPGDVISLGETFGWINSLGARYVSVVTRDGREYLIPNEDLITGQVVNWSHSDDFVRLDIFFGTAYGDDPHIVRKVAIEAAMSVDRVLKQPKTPVCHIVGFGDSSVDYILRFWIKDPTGGLTNIRGNVYLALWDAFQSEGIHFPFPQREIRMLEDDTPSASKLLD
ncbi:mechanosensitive ion channel family protein [Cognatishimia activa]|uniref:Putative MscS family protein.1 n=1 Tax=Cognatishimia activa TaxID=1715691 RepID=A0A0P1JC80_9RHOB|nr:mechanosensitive ion channel domain-containing protein [Cognatishimia activa]CUI50315.1 putative MscS family protein.1 precursor [Cognatishimia activa]CUK27361.1 putative MscS family protein.1 precursor [Cognatishimia activa]